MLNAKALKKHAPALSTVLLLALAVLAFQNCSKTGPEVNSTDNGSGGGPGGDPVPGNITLLDTNQRAILLPPDAANPAAGFVVDHVNKPNDKFYLDVRYQRPNPSDSLSTPVRYATSYDASAGTGLGPLTSSQQRGPIGGSQAQSTFQLNGAQGGLLMRSWDSPHPSKLPQCQPNCTGYHKHTIYEYHWSNPSTIFTSTSKAHALEVEADIQVHQFENWSAIDNGPPRGVVAGQVAYVFFLEDLAGKQIQYVVFLYDSNLATNGGDEGVNVEPIGNGDNGYYISSSVKKSRSMRYTTVPSTNQYDYSDKTWNGFRHFKIRITPDNLANAIADLNARGGTLSTDVSSYKISHVGLNHEVYYEDNQDTWVLGASFENLRVSENLGTDPAPTIANKGFPIVSAWVNNGLNCNKPDARLYLEILGAGSTAKGCIAFTLTAPARAGETSTCTASSSFVPLTAPGFSFRPGVNVITPTASTALMNNTNYVPGTYQVFVMTANGTIAKSAPFTLKTTGSNPNSCFQ